MLDVIWLLGVVVLFLLLALCVKGVAAILGIAAVVYLVIALVRPERF